MSDSASQPRREEGKRHLIIVRAGDTSLHANWLLGSEQRDFDLLISYYGKITGQFERDGDLYHRMEGTRWQGHDAIFRDRPDIIDQYDYVCFACDDLDASTNTWNALFQFCKRYDLDLAQPSILGPVSHVITAPVEHVLYRLTNFVEIMCPIFSRRALAICCPTFSESISGWGLDGVWPTLLQKHYFNIGMIDKLPVTHTRPVGEGSLYKTIAKLGVDPMTELNNLSHRYDITNFDKLELLRIYESSQ